MIAKGAAADGGDRLIKFARVGEEKYAVPASVSEVVPFAFAFANVKWVDFSSSNVTELPAGCFRGSCVEKNNAFFKNNTAFVRRSARV